MMCEWRPPRENHPPSDFRECPQGGRRPKPRGSLPAELGVRYAVFGLGSTYAFGICWEMGIDPDVAGGLAFRRNAGSSGHTRAGTVLLHQEYSHSQHLRPFRSSTLMAGI